MRIGILGFGREGKSVFKFLKKTGFLPKKEIWILDKNPNIKIPPGCRNRLGKNYLSALKDFSIVFRTPGVPYNLPKLAAARRAGVEFSSLTKLFFDNCPGKIIGLTGTKGKGTTSTLLFNILQAARKSVFLAGNIGRAALDILPEMKTGSFAVLELSSFQLQDLKKSPPVAVVLDVFPDHQNAHLNLKEYYDAKANIARFQKSGDAVFFFARSRMSRWAAGKGRGKKIAIDEGKFGLFGPKDLKIRGYHNFKNAMMAANVAMLLAVPQKIILETVKKFRGMEHRLEFVRKIMVRRAHRKNKSAIYFYNDSASTNPQTAAVAILSFTEPSVLIAGGQDKRLDYEPLAEALKNSGVKLVVLFGENKRKIHKAIKNSGVPIKSVANLSAAVKSAYSTAKNLRPATYRLQPTVILFSPGATSFDMFQNYADRGEKFKKIVRRLH